MRCMHQAGRHSGRTGRWIASGSLQQVRQLGLVQGMLSSMEGSPSREEEQQALANVASFACAYDDEAETV